MKVWLLVACCWSIASGKIVLDRYSYNFNSQAVNMTFKMNSTNQSNTDFSYDIDVYHKVDLITENMIVSLMAPQQKDSNDFDKSISKTTLNICSLTETISSNMWMKSIFKPVMGCMSFKAKCPALKGRYKVTCQLPEVCTDSCFLPDYLTYGRFLVKITLTAKWGKRRRMTEIFSVLVYGKYEA